MNLSLDDLETLTQIAITAASGQLGSAILKATVALLPKESVIGLARTPDKAQHLGVEIRPGDYNDKDALEKSLQSVDTLLLVSGMDDPEKRIGQHWRRGCPQANTTFAVDPSMRTASPNRCLGRSVNQVEMQFSDWTLR